MTHPHGLSIKKSALRAANIYDVFAALIKPPIIADYKYEIRVIRVSPRHPRLKKEKKQGARF